MKQNLESVTENPIFKILEDKNLDESVMENPIFKLLKESSDNPTEKEIKKHKDKITYLTNKLNNTFDIDKEISINNEIKNETEFLSSLLKKRKNELNKNNNNMNTNNK